MRRACMLAATAALVAAFGGVGTEAKAQFSRETPIVQAVRKTQGAVVSLRVEKKGVYGRKESVGSGVIVDERGYVVTNRHVIASADQIIVRLLDGTDLRARVVAEDPGHDLAILRVQAGRRLQALPLGPASDLMVGETVIAIGHPFGYTNTVSTGIISALGREVTLPSGELLGNLIQINASINPGNSGGPLFNINGELIGINVALRENAQGIAFAINADTVQQVLSRHLSAVNLAKVVHGLRCVETVVPEGAARQQVMVRELVNPTAASAGLKPGDHILRVGDLPVSNRFDVERALWECKAGDKVPLTVARQGKVITVDLTLAAASEDPGRER
ncbi:MAG TPA: trypsin-like peptidase domain-containing protein [Gemmataceae bacterium]|nr:trypsin-like peptidase domain-containing protein [Gemmataceae bacterium]